MGYSLVNLDAIEPSGPGGAIRFVRRELGLAAFGINWFELLRQLVAEGHEPEALAGLVPEPLRGRLELGSWARSSSIVVFESKRLQSRMRAITPRRRARLRASRAAPARR